MSYFIVHQNKTYNEEMEGGYLWAPQKTASGKEIYHWTNMTKVKDGDIIFSSYRRNIVSVNISNGQAKEANRPSALDKVNLWEDKGWLLKAKYNVLTNPISIDDNLEKILQLAPAKYSPFTKEGRGSQGYLFEIGKELGDYILNIAKNQNEIDIISIDNEKQYIKDIDNLLSKFKDETEKQRIVKTRVGQELFKKKLLAKSCKCAICGMNIKQLLRASHCKPWGKADNIERLDVNNGLLLCPTHDALFDNGMISFENDGSIIISNSIDKSQYQLLNIDKNIKLNFTKEQLNYIKYHREEEFK